MRIATQQTGGFGHSKIAHRPSGVRRGDQSGHRQFLLKSFLNFHCSMPLLLLVTLSRPRSMTQSFCNLDESLKASRMRNAPKGCFTKKKSHTGTSKRSRQQLCFRTRVVSELDTLQGHSRWPSCLRDLPPPGCVSASRCRRRSQGAKCINDA